MHKTSSNIGIFRGNTGLFAEIQGFFAKNRALTAGLFCGKTGLSFGNIGLRSFQVYCQKYFAGIFWGIQGSFVNVHGSFP